jgi:hypothetical protein
MTYVPPRFKSMDLDGLLVNTGEPGSQNAHDVEFEILRRQTVAVQEQARAQIESARYMLWSLIALTATSGLNALFAFLIWYAPRGH